MAETVISFRDVTFRYTKDGKPALNKINLDIEKGTFVAVLGHNGSGKSTLAKHMNGILTPSEGTVSVLGMDTNNEDNLMDIRKNVGMVFQNPDNQIVASVVEDDVAFAPENLGVESSEIRRRVDENMRRLGIYDYRLFSPHHLSGGQKQRVAIAGVLAMQPGCIVMDEPTAMLDPSGRSEVLKAIHEMRSMGMTIILITHHMVETIRADRLLVMSQGEIIMDGTPQEVFNHPEELQKHNLGVPETVNLLWQLQKEGWDVPLDALEIDDCADVIAEYLLRK